MVTSGIALLDMRPLVSLLAILLLIPSCTTSIPRPIVAHVSHFSDRGNAPTFLPRLGSPPSCVRVLSIDGGGTRGLLPAMVLEEIEKRTGKPIARLFDLIVGTSTGSILALALTKPAGGFSMDEPRWNAHDLVNLYKSDGAKVFPAERRGRVGDFIRVFGPKYSPGGLTGVLENYLGDTRLSKALTSVMVPSYDIEHRRHYFFRSHPFRHKNWMSAEDVYSGKGYMMKDVVRAATAAPTYFSPVKLIIPQEYRSTFNFQGEFIVLIDGGVFANNPTGYAISEAYEMVGEEGLGALVVSLGTGRSNISMKYDDAVGWGLLGWSSRLLSIIFSDAGLEEEFRTLVEPGNYFRINKSLENFNDDLDDASDDQLEALRNLGELMIKEYTGRLDELVQKLTSDRSTECIRRLERLER